MDNFINFVSAEAGIATNSFSREKLCVAWMVPLIDLIVPTKGKALAS